MKKVYKLMYENVLLKNLWMIDLWPQLFSIIRYTELLIDSVNTSFDMYTNFISCYNNYNKYLKILLFARMQASIRQINKLSNSLSNIPTL